MFAKQNTDYMSYATLHVIMNLEKILKSSNQSLQFVSASLPSILFGVTEYAFPSLFPPWVHFALIPLMQGNQKQVLGILICYRLFFNTI